MNALTIFGLVGVAAAVALFLAGSIRASRRRGSIDLDDIKASAEPPIVGGARVGSWYVSFPFAVLVASEMRLFVGGRFRYVPLEPMLIERAEVSRIEWRHGLLGGQCLRAVFGSGDPVPVIFFAKGAAEQLESLGWPVVAVPGTSWFGWT